MPNAGRSPKRLELVTSSWSSYYRQAPVLAVMNGAGGLVRTLPKMTERKKTVDVEDEAVGGGGQGDTEDKF